MIVIDSQSMSDKVFLSASRKPGQPAFAPWYACLLSDGIFV